MADTPRIENESKADRAAEKAYADAADEVSIAKIAAAVEADGDAKPVEAEADDDKKTPMPVKTAPVTTAPVKSAPVQNAAANKTPPKAGSAAKQSSGRTEKKAPKASPAKSKAKPAAAKKSAAAKPAAAAPSKPAKPKPVNPAPAKPTIAELKEKIMATKPETTEATQNVAAKMQEQAKSAYAKINEFAGEMAEFTKGNVEALVQSTKIYAEGVQSMGRREFEDARTAFETMTADLKKMAAVKSPAELFQMQSEIARRNFDALVAHTSQNVEESMKLVNDAYAPISNRVSLAAEKISKVA